MKPVLESALHLAPTFPDFGAQKFTKKCAEVWQIFFDFGAPPTQNSAGAQRVCFKTRMAAAKLAAESVLHSASRLRDFGVRKRAKIHDTTRERVTNFV